MWARVITIALGIWLMVAPVVLSSTSVTGVCERTAGPVAIFVGVLSLRAVTRPLRAINVLTGMFLLIAPWVGSITGAQQVNVELVGWALIVLSFPRGPLGQRMGGGWSAIFQQVV